MKQINRKEFYFGICISPCTPFVPKGCLVKILNYKPNHVVLSLLNNNKILISPNHLSFNVVERKLFKYLNAINNFDERLKFYRNTEWHEFVLQLEKNTLVNIICPDQETIAVVEDVIEDQWKILLKMQLLEKPSRSLIESLNTICIKCDSAEMFKYSCPANIIKRLTNTEKLIEGQLNGKIVWVWKCRVCETENKKIFKTCTICMIPNKGCVIIPKIKQNVLDNHLKRHVWMDAEQISKNITVDNKFHHRTTFQRVKSPFWKCNQLPNKKDLSIKYSALKPNPSNSVLNEYTPSNVETVAKIPKQILIDFDKSQINNPLKTFIVPPINPNRNHKIIEPMKDVRNNMNQYELNHKTVSQASSSDISNHQIIPYINPRVKQPVTHSRPSNCVPAAILHKMGKHNIENVCVQGDYIPFILPQVQYDDETTEQSPTSNKPMPKNVPVNVSEISEAGDDPTIKAELYNQSTHVTIAKHTHCTICNRISRNGIQLDCLHTFCPSCFVKSFSDVDHLYCPFKTKSYQCSFKLDAEDFRSLLEMISKSGN